ncbi:GIY-YIG nuclease family protein [Microbacterium luticocti]|uniref:GIY-YIG nuclease family protein n=1 Tax=Microbacterium luticocti TaxID=451764 RepID=UPI0003FC84BD|nr:GIY-YIG nuclease family protein [Microbacterium luticocti]
MPLTLGPLLIDAGIDPAQALVIRHAYVREHEDSGLAGIHADSTDAEILEYTRNQSANTMRFPANPPRVWVVFIREGGDQARLWSVVENRGETSSDGIRRVFDVAQTEHMEDLRNRLVVGWKSPRTWRMKGTTAAHYPVVGIADAQPIPFPGFDRLVLSHAQLQAVMREHRYASWRTALSSVFGIYLITDTRDGRHYVGKADGEESIRQRWHAYATNGHGGNVELRGLDPSTFRFSLLRVFDPSTPSRDIDAAESHFKDALDSRRHGLNRN